MSTESKLNNAFLDAKRLPLLKKSKYVLFSDCHRGIGNSNDNFLKNQNLYFAALKHYYEQGFSYIELGDGDELWENTSIEQIIETHNNVFWLFSLYHKKDRLHLLYGNHDMVKKNKNYIQKNCKTYFCTESQKIQPLFPNMQFFEGLILDNVEKPENSLYLTHGHQASSLNSTFWRLSRFLVRYLWNPLENSGVLDPTSAAKNYTQKEKIEKRLNKWATDNDKILITGHTHRPMLNKDSPHFFNTGSCVHPRCVTCIELEDKALTLVKWTIGTRPNRDLFVTREVLEGPLYIDEL